MASDFKKMEQKSTFSYFSPHQLKVISEIYLGASTGPLTESKVRSHSKITREEILPVYGRTKLY